MAACWSLGARAGSAAPDPALALAQARAEQGALQEAYDSLQRKRPGLELAQYVAELALLRSLAERAGAEVARLQGASPRATGARPTMQDVIARREVAAGLRQRSVAMLNESIKTVLRQTAADLEASAARAEPVVRAAKSMTEPKSEPAVTVAKKTAEKTMETPAPVAARGPEPTYACRYTDEGTSRKIEIKVRRSSTSENCLYDTGTLLVVHGDSEARVCASFSEGKLKVRLESLLNVDQGGGHFRSELAVLHQGAQTWGSPKPLVVSDRSGGRVECRLRVEPPRDDELAAAVAALRAIPKPAELVAGGLGVDRAVRVNLESDASEGHAPAWLTAALRKSAAAAQ